MSKSMWLWAMVAVVVAGGAYWYTSKPSANETPTLANSDMSSETSGQEAPGPSTVPSGTGTGTGGVSAEVSVNTGTSATPSTASVSYNGTSYSPKDVTVKRGGTVTWTNTGSGSMWVASAQHPSHTAYAGTTRQEHCPDAAGTAFDQCAGGQTYSFTFTKAGKWNYHDHMNASAFGSVTVVE